MRRGQGTHNESYVILKFCFRFQNVNYSIIILLQSQYFSEKKTQSL